MKLCINDFEGPLDLLLHLVKTAKMDIYEIDTKYIIDKYLEFIESIPKDDLDDASEYLVMAAELIHLKSRLLLNLDSDSDDNDDFTINSEEDLKNKLIEYERYQNVTNVFKELEEKRNEFFTKLPENLNIFVDKKEKLEVTHTTDVSNEYVDVGDKINYYINVTNTEYFYSGLSELKVDLLKEATKDAKDRATGMLKATHNRPGKIQSVNMGVFQITPVDSTNVSDMGINDTSSIDKKVTAVANVVFRIK